MGKFKNGNISGAVGKIIVYEYRGKSCCRSMPKNVRQTKATKKSAVQFGLAVRASKYLRWQLGDFLPDEKDKAMLYGFNYSIHKWLRELQPDSNTSSTSNFFIDHFQFNNEALLPVLVKKPIGARFLHTGDIIIDIPELIPGMDIIAPAGTVRIHFQVEVAGCILKFGSKYNCADLAYELEENISASATLEYGDQLLPQQSLSLHLKQEKSALQIAVLRVQYEVQKYGELEVVTDKGWQPAGIVGSCFGIVADNKA